MNYTEEIKSIKSIISKIDTDSIKYDTCNIKKKMNNNKYTQYFNLPSQCSNRISVDENAK